MTTNIARMEDLINSASQLGHASDRVGMFFFILFGWGVAAWFVRRMSQRETDVIKQNAELHKEMRDLSVSMRDALNTNTHALNKISEAVEELVKRSGKNPSV